MKMMEARRYQHIALGHHQQQNHCTYEAAFAPSPKVKTNHHGAVDQGTLEKIIIQPAATPQQYEDDSIYIEHPA
jgi:hypothetical protein